MTSIKPKTSHTEVVKVEEVEVDAVVLVSSGMLGVMVTVPSTVVVTS